MSRQCQKHVYTNLTLKTLAHTSSYQNKPSKHHTCFYSADFTMATTPKSSKSTPWLTCETCNATILNKDTGQHKNSCPPDLKNPQHDFIVNGVLFGSVDVKTNEDVKNLSSAEKDGMVFLSQSAIQILNLCIGGFVIVECLEAPISPMVRVVWPTTEKSSSSVLFTKGGKWCFKLHLH